MLINHYTNKFQIFNKRLVFQQAAPSSPDQHAGETIKPSPMTIEGGPLAENVAKATELRR